MTFKLKPTLETETKHSEILLSNVLDSFKGSDTYLEKHFIIFIYDYFPYTFLSDITYLSFERLQELNYLTIKGGLSD